MTTCVYYVKFNMSLCERYYEAICMCVCVVGGCEAVWWEEGSCVGWGEEGGCEAVKLCGVGGGGKGGSQVY